MRIVFAGTPIWALASLELLANSNHELLAVVTRPDRPAGRGKQLTQSPVAATAKRLGLPVLKPGHPKDPAFLEQLEALNPDAVAVVAYGALLPESALAIPKHGWINLHFSLLPAWRGAAPVQRALWAGDQITGATTFRIVKELDAGPVFGLMTYEPPVAATAGEVLEALAVDGAKLLAATLDSIESGQARPVAQSTDGVSYAPKVTVDDARVDWSAPAAAVDRQIRACTPQPGAWTIFRGKRLKLRPLARPAVGSAVEVEGGAEPGSIVPLKHEVLVRTGSGLVRLGEVAPAGKSWMRAEAWARGLRLDRDRPSGERLGE